MERIESGPKPRFVSPNVRAAAETIPEIEHYELDGIPLFHLPGTGATTLSLSFGVGTAHEPVPQRGMTHLAEHLILTAIDRALDHSNGTTEPFRVTFSVRGSAQDASKFLRDVCEQIERPRLARMHEEAHVLRSEAQTRPDGMSPAYRLWWLRTGNVGLGTAHMREYFLAHLDEQVLREWIARHLVAGNAVLWVAGPLPEDLYVNLPPGPATPMPAFEEIPGLETPVVVGERVDGVGASFVVERSVAIQAALRSLESRLKKALRVDRGLGYIVGTSYQPVSAEKAFASVFTSCLPASVYEVQQAVLQSIDDLAARGSTDDELGDQYERMVRDLADPIVNAGRLDAWCQDWLMGHSPDQASVLVDRLWRLAPEEVAKAFTAARATMLLMLPTTAKRPQRLLRDYPGPSLEPMGDGHLFEISKKARDEGRYGKARIPKLFVGKTGVALTVERGPRYAAIRWDEAVAVVRHGRARAVLARDGSLLALRPEDWRDGDYAAALIDRWAPTPLVTNEP